MTVARRRSNFPPPLNFAVPIFACISLTLLASPVDVVLAQTTIFVFKITHQDDHDSIVFSTDHEGLNNVSDNCP
jgi:hypothetical protein